MTLLKLKFKCIDGFSGLFHCLTIGVSILFLMVFTNQGQAASGPSNTWVQSINLANAIVITNAGAPGLVGCFFSTGSSNVTVTHLGACQLPGETGSATVELISDDGKSAVLATATVNFTGSPNNTNIYAACFKPYVLNTNTTYFVEAFLGNGQRYYVATSGALVTTTPVAACLGEAFGGTNALLTPGGSYVPVSFGYSLGGTYTGPPQPTNYFVDNAGSDMNTGLAGSPWQHVGYACSNAPNGSTIFLTSGQTFSQDNIILQSQSHLFITSSGSTSATVVNVGSTNPVFACYNSSSITFSNLNIYGYGQINTNVQACIEFFSNMPLASSTNNSVINCTLTNAQRGVAFYMSFASQHVFDNLTVTGNQINNISYYGVEIYDYIYNWGPGINIANNGNVSGNTITNVTGVPVPAAGGEAGSGTGIAVWQSANWQICSNLIYHCGYNQGMVGGNAAIFPVSYSSNMHIQGNVIFDIKADLTYGDGDGIDLDYATQNSVVEGNFVRDCSGPGLYSDIMAGNNIFRWNVVVNCGTNILNEAGVAFNENGLTSSGTNWFYNNTVVGGNGGFFYFGQGTSNNIVANNIFCETAGQPQIVMNPSQGFTNAVTYIGNCYYPTFNVSWNGITYTSLDAWRAATGQEPGSTGSTNNPLFVVGAGNIVSNYMLQAASALRGAGINMQKLYGVNAGVVDVLGNTPLSSGNNVGGLVKTAGTGTFYFLTVNSGSGTGNYSNGVTANLTANVISGYNFINWSGPNIANPSLASTTVTVYSNTTVTANYAPALGGSSLNVADYGANGDAATFFVNATSNSAVLTTANSLSSADVGKTIELFGAGPLGTSTNHQDLVAVITGVVNATNIVLDRVCGATTNNCYAIYGTNNAGAIQACIDAAPSNSVINIPDGNYLVIGSEVLDTNFISSSPYITYPSIVISKGGVTLLGQSRDNTVLLGCGAWQNKGPWVYRGYMFACEGPVTNNGPLVFDTLTMDGGVQQGFTGVTAFPASTATGDGWDVTHDAVNDVGLPPFHNTKIFRNCTITRWRGEQVKSVASGWDGFISITNCSFSDGDGSGINFNFTHNIDNCLFSNLFEVMEFYQGYCSNTCYLQNCTVTNVQALMALNGAQSTRPNPAYIVRNNIFYPNFGNGIQTTPVQNLTISNNVFIGGGYPIAIGVPGYQGSTMNSNILVVCNVFSNNWTPIEIEGSAANSLVNLLVSNNVAYGTSSHLLAESESGGWGTNMVFVNNFTTNFSVGLSGAGLSGQYFIDSDSNVFPPHQIYAVAGTNEIGYENGQRHAIESAQSNSVFYTDNIHSNQIPAGAKLGITNLTSWTVPVYLSARMSGSPVTLSPNQSFTAYWTGTSWTTNAGGGSSGPASIQVTPGSVPFGTLLTGTSWTNSLLVQNVGGSVLTGTASVGAPYNILSGGNYSLGANQSQSIVVAFNPTGAGNFNQNLNFTGGGGTSVALSGSATNLPATGPMIQISPGTINYGIVSTGTSATQSFQVQNVGSGTLTGSATVGTPFSITSGGTYSLNANQSQMVKVTFSPGAAGTYNLNVAFSGGGGTNATVIGRAFLSSVALRPPTNLTNQPAGDLTNGQ